ncbi:MAG TPA: hypothetical protein VH640_25690 [Bryobacteraceae bacterium]
MSPNAPESSGRFAAALAGLQAGMMAALAMLLWLGVSAVWQRRTFWTSENLLATTFYGSRALHDGFSASTFSGLALYLLLYSTLGCLFAYAVGKRGPSPRLVLVGIAAGLGWYYLSFHLLWRAVGPLVPILHAVTPTVLGHMIYGAGIGRFPHFLPVAPVAPVEPVPEPAPASTEVRD